MPSYSSLRFVLSLLLAACSTSAFDTDEREAPDFPDGAVLWQLERYLDQNGSIPPRAWETALRARQLTIAAAAAGPDAGGISPLAWTQRGPDNVAGRCRAIAIDPRNPQRLWAGAVSGGLWRSDDGGADWTQIDDWWRNLSVGCLTLDPQNPDVMYVGTGEGFYSLAHLARNLSHFVRGAGVMKSSDGGVSWTQLPGTALWQSTTRIAVAPTDPNLVLAARRPGGVARSTDGGQTWTDVTNGLVTDPFSLQVCFDPNDGSKAVAHLAPGSVASHGVITSIDGGLTWQPALTGLQSVAGESSRIELAYARSVPGMVYAATGFNGGKVWQSTDGGRNWTQRSSSTTNLGMSYYYDGLWVDPTNAGNLVVSALQVHRSSNGGQTFTQISNGYIMTTDPHPDAHTVVGDPGDNGTIDRRVYVGTDGGVHVADDILAAAQGSGWRDLDATMRSTQFYGAAAHATNDVLVAGAQDNGTLRVVGSNPAASLVFGGDGGQVQIDPTNPAYVYGEYVYAQVHRSSNGGTSASYVYTGIGDAGAAATANFISPLRLDPNLSTRLYVGGASLWRSNNARGTSLGWTAVKPAVGSLIASIAVAPGLPDR
ncbi:MAG TPA: hypothetical protein VK348_10895, partial [Planctomycetota bacterium]|nr:hypothetical protein [Planctomycetota bacterium]